MPYEIVDSSHKYKVQGVYKFRYDFIIDVESFVDDTEYYELYEKFTSWAINNLCSEEESLRTDRWLVYGVSVANHVYVFFREPNDAMRFKLEFM